MDYHPATDRIVGVGSTQDTGIVTNIVSGSYWSPYIVVYQGPLMSYLWGKSIALRGNYYTGVTFSEDGTYIVAVTYYYRRTISVFRAIDGFLFDLRQ